MRITRAETGHLEQILTIYNQGIEDRIATLEEDIKDHQYIENWFCGRGQRYAVLVAEEGETVAGWASLNPYSHRCAYAGVADLSIYVHRAFRGKGVGTKLIREMERVACDNNFHKLVLFTFPFNEAGQKLYRKMGFREVGIFHRQGKLDGQFVNVMAMEKLLD